MRENLIHIGLFDGIGGFSLACRNEGITTIAWCEIDQFCQQTLKYNFPNAQGFSDIKEMSAMPYRNRVTFLTGGFPCQPFSVAGERKGDEDERFLWREMLRIADECRPQYLVAENVLGLLSSLESASGEILLENETVDLFCKKERTLVSRHRRVMGGIISDLEKIGYDLPRLEDGTPVILCVPAASVGAIHLRQRVWIVAYPKGAELQRSGDSRNRRAGYSNQNVFDDRTVTNSDLQWQLQQSGIIPEQWRRDRNTDKEIDTNTHGTGWRQCLPATFSGYTGEHTGHDCSDVANTKRIGGQSRKRKCYGKKEKQASGAGETLPCRESAIRVEWQPTSVAELLCEAYGIPGGLVSTSDKWQKNKKIKALGNAIVPQVAQAIIRSIIQHFHL